MNSSALNYIHVFINKKTRDLKQWWQTGKNKVRMK
jgi:hypothetical protein